MRTFRVVYCPVHEWEREDCDEWCAPRRDELRRLDNALRKYFYDRGYMFEEHEDAEAAV